MTGDVAKILCQLLQSNVETAAVPDGRDVLALKRLNGEGGEDLGANGCQTVDLGCGVGLGLAQEGAERPVHGGGSFRGQHTCLSGEAREAVEHPALLP